jgi:thioredoxin reductase (NADPH)
MEAQAAKFGAEFLVGKAVTGLFRLRDKIAVTTEDGTTYARSVVVAAGETTPKLDALKPFEGRGVDYSCDAAMLDQHAGQNVVLVGGGNSCAQLGLALADTDAKSVTIISRSLPQETTSLYLRSRLANSRVKLIIGEVEKAYGKGDPRDNGWTEVVGELKIARGATFRKKIKADQVYVFISGIPPTGWFPGALDAMGYILTGHDVPVEDWPLERHPYPQESSVPGVFVAGDIRAGATGGITVALGEGTQAFQHIKRTYLPSLIPPDPPEAEPPKVVPGPATGAQCVSPARERMFGR